MWLGRFGHSTTAFQPMLSPLRTSSTLSSPPFVLSRRYKALDPPKQPTKTKHNQFSKTFWWSSWSFEGTVSSEEGCLNTLRLFSRGGELHLSFFFFSLKKSPQNWTSFSTVWGEWKSSPRFRTAKSYFWIDVLQRKRPMATAPITKAEDMPRSWFCFPPEKPNQSEAKKNTFTFWKCWRQIFPKMKITPKIRQKWTVYFWFGTPWLSNRIKIENLNFSRSISQPAPLVHVSACTNGEPFSFS